jgi:CheY-like chemotaxis protein
MTRAVQPPILLLAGERARYPADAIGDDWCSVRHLRGGADMLAWVQSNRPDTVVIDLELPDMSGLVACRLLSDDPRVGHGVPILLVSSNAPTPAQRVAALGAGAWDFVHCGESAMDLALKIRTYVQAKRNIDIALAEGSAGLPTRFFDRPVLARRARELGALMARKHGALACLVLEPDPPLDEIAIGRALALTARVSDVVGVWGPTTLALIAPDTDDDGAVRLARRVTQALDRPTPGAQVEAAARPRIRIGYCAVSDLTYRAVDPLELFVQAAAALRSGVPDADAPWIRRFDSARPSGAVERAHAISPAPTRTVP